MRPREEAGLFKHPTGIWYWRRVDPKTGRRLIRTTGTRRKEMAVRKAAQFDDEWEKNAAGMPTFDWARVELRPLVDDWIAEQITVTEHTRKIRRRHLTRAFDGLKLTVVADLCDLAALDRRLRAIECTPAKRHKGYQVPLKQFSRWLAENNRYTERDLLATWKKLPVPAGEVARRAMLPEELARAFVAADQLDIFHRRKHPTRPVLLGLLVSAPRATAFSERDVEHLREGRIDYGEGIGNKRNGWARSTPRPRMSCASTSGAASTARCSSRRSATASTGCACSISGRKSSASACSASCCPRWSWRTAS